MAIKHLYQLKSNVYGNKNIYIKKNAFKILPDIDTIYFYKNVIDEF